jgi:hypothetical protein
MRNCRAARRNRQQIFIKKRLTSAELPRDRTIH